MLRLKKNIPSDLFKSFHDAFELSKKVTGIPVDHYYRIGRFTVRVCFAGSSLIPHITPAMEHLETRPGKAHLTVYAFDSRSVKTKIHIPWEINRFSTGEIWSLNNEQWMIVYQPACHTFQILNKSDNQAIYWIHDASHVPYHDKGSPFRLILQRCMKNHGLELIHAAAVGYPERGLLLAGKGGSGKSTATLACLESDLMIAGDDYCLVSNHPFLKLFSLYNTGKLNAADVDQFPGLKPAVMNSDRLDKEKALYYLYQHNPKKMLKACPVAALLILKITNNRKTSFKKASPAQGFLALTPSSIYQLHRTEQKTTLHILNGIVRQIPNYILELGTDIRQIPEVISSLLRGHSE